VSAYGQRSPHEPVLASAPEAEEMEDLQFALGQGPCMDAVAGRGPVLVPDLTRLDAQRRWPLFAAAATDRGVRGCSRSLWRSAPH
jgi:hypothetical protein